MQESNSKNINFFKIDSSRAKEIVDKIKKLPPLPAIAAKAFELILTDDPDIQEISSLISKDTSLSARLLSCVNSPYYMLPQPITDIKKSVLVLGITEVKDIILKVITSELIFKNLLKITQTN